MDIGRLRHTVEIQRLVSGAQDQETGDLVTSWQTIATVRASIDAVSGRELITAQAMDSEVSYRITVRMTDVVAKDRIKYGSDLYDVTAALPDNIDSRRYLTLMCSKGLNNG